LIEKRAAESAKSSMRKNRDSVLVIASSASSFSYSEPARVIR
jgi:hypothetical protein